MNSNRQLKIVWMICGAAILLLFCTQAYWLYNQCQYSLDQQVEQFKKDCDMMLEQDLQERSCKRKVLLKETGIRLLSEPMSNMILTIKMVERAR